MTKARKIVADAINAYMDATGWSQAEFTDAVGLNKALVSQYRSGKRGLSLRAAMMIENATTIAKTRGLTKIAPLRVLDLLPALAGEVGIARTGTDNA